MSAAQIPDIPGINANDMYRQETVTDLKVGSIQCLKPILADGSPDDGRSPRFIGSTSIMTPQGMLPVQADIEADCLEDAVKKFPEAMKAGIERMIEEAREMEREMRSGIVVPKGPLPENGAGGGQPGKPGGGLILS